MIAQQHDLTLRPITGREELDLFSRLPYVVNEELAGDLGAGRRRPEWMWMALRGDRLVARAARWSRSQDDAPFLLDVFDIDDATHVPERLDTGVRLLKTAMAEVVPPGWRDDPAARQIVKDRMAVLERTGARLFVERLRLEWRPDGPLPPPSTRLAFRPVSDTAELLPLMTGVLDGTLDAHSREDLTRISAREAAAAHYQDELAHYASPRHGWRIATLPDGEPVGFVIPARNSYNAIIAYLAVLPAHRGNGYVDFEREINMSWS